MLRGLILLRAWRVSGTALEDVCVWEKLID